MSRSTSRRTRRISGKVASGQAHVAICNWRDLRHPDGGGSELYVESVAKGLAAAGNRVTLLCAAVDGQRADEDRDGIHYRRRGGRISVYLCSAWALLSRQVRPDVVLDVQNGIPYLSTLVTGRPVVTLVHHAHREQWPIVFGPRAARVGWWVESRLAPRLYRRSRYIAVSDATRDELVTQGVDAHRISVVHNGSPVSAAPRVGRSAAPRIVVLGRLVPHKRVEIVLRAAAVLRATYPTLRVDLVGHGWWDAELRDEATRLGLDEVVQFHGFVDDQAKSDLLRGAWVNAVPSVKEGWALTVVEAGRQQTPSIAFDDAGGLSESIRDGVTGVLVHGGQAEFTEALGRLLGDDESRELFGKAAREWAEEFTWESATVALSAVLDAALGTPAALSLDLFVDSGPALVAGA
jgi:glycosyltransferase involved in cell wall biosynthesis